MEYPKLPNGPSPEGEAKLRGLKQLDTPFLSASGDTFQATKSGEFSRVVALVPPDAPQKNLKKRLYATSLDAIETQPNRDGYWFPRAEFRQLQRNPREDFKKITGELDLFGPREQRYYPDSEPDTDYLFMSDEAYRTGVFSSGKGRAILVYNEQERNGGSVKAVHFVDITEPGKYKPLYRAYPLNCPAYNTYVCIRPFVSGRKEKVLMAEIYANYFNLPEPPHHTTYTSRVRLWEITFKRNGVSSVVTTQLDTFGLAWVAAVPAVCVSGNLYLLVIAGASKRTGLQDQVKVILRKGNENYIVPGFDSQDPDTYVEAVACETIPGGALVAFLDEVLASDFSYLYHRLRLFRISFSWPAGASPEVTIEDSRTWTYHKNTYGLQGAFIHVAGPDSWHVGVEYAQYSDVELRVTKRNVISKMTLDGGDSYEDVPAIGGRVWFSQPKAVGMKPDFYFLGDEDQGQSLFRFDPDSQQVEKDCDVLRWEVYQRQLRTGGSKTAAKGAVGMTTVAWVGDRARPAPAGPVTFLMVPGTPMGGPPD